MGIKRVVTICMVSIIISIVLINPCLAASAINVNILSLIPDEQLEKLGDLTISELRVSSLKEDEDNYYYLIGEKYNGIGILKTQKGEITKSTYYSIFDSNLQEAYIRNFDIADDGSIWLEQYNPDTSITYISKINKDNNINTIELNDFFRRGVLAGGKAAWMPDENTLKVWDGKEILSFDISRKDVVDIAIYKNDLVYINNNHEIYQISKEGVKKLTVLSVPVTIDGYEKSRLSLWSNNETLWAVVSYTNSMLDFDKPLSELIDGRLINVTENKVYQASIETILKAVSNRDGSFYFLGRPHMFFIPRYPMYDDICEVTIGKDGDIKYNKVECHRWWYIKQSYLDYQGNLWRYNIQGNENGAIQASPDGTTVNYYFNRSVNNKPEISVSINGINVEFDVAPYAENQRIMVPLRGFASIIGATVEWVKDENKIIIEKQDKKIELIVGNSKALVDGKEVILDAPAEAKNGRTMVPIRFISESFFADVKWENNSKTVRISTITE